MQYAMPGRYHLIDEVTLDLVTKFLTLDPAERISAQEALQHPFFKAQNAD
jgi:serine/threonine protein kinase